jgi:hypothetical protein
MPEFTQTLAHGQAKFRAIFVFFFTGETLLPSKGVVTGVNGALTTAILMNENGSSPTAVCRVLVVA